MPGFYDSTAKGYNELHYEEQVKKLNIILSELQVKKTDRLLDVGCGTGFSFDFIDCECYGIDPSVSLLRQCRKQGVALAEGIAEKLPYADDYFDIVISVTAVHNFTDPEKGLNEIRRVGRRFAVTILKKSQKHEPIRKMICSLFRVIKEIDEGTDTVFIMEK